MLIEFDERVKDDSKVSQGNCIVKMIDDKGLEDEVKKLNMMPLHLRTFVLSKSKRLMNKSNHAIERFCTNDVFHTDTDSF